MTHEKGGAPTPPTTNTQPSSWRGPHKDSIRNSATESEILKTLIQWLHFIGCDVTRCNSGSMMTSYKSKKTGITKKHRIQFGKKGMGDIVAISPYGRWIEVEGKRVGQDQKEHQIRRQQEVECRGGVYILARSIDDLEARKAHILAKPRWGTA